MPYKIPALKFKGENDILLFSMSAADLREISYLNHRDVDREEGISYEIDNRV